MCVLDFVSSPPKEIAVVCADATDLLNVVFGEYRPNQLVASKGAGAESEIPLLEERVMINDKATAYVCQNFVCQMPVTALARLAEELR